MTKNDLLVDFAGNLKKLRMERGLTLRDLAEAVNIGRANLSEYERGITDPSLTAVLKLASYFDVSIGWLTGESMERGKYDER